LFIHQKKEKSSVTVAWGYFGWGSNVDKWLLYEHWPVCHNIFRRELIS